MIFVYSILRLRLRLLLPFFVAVFNLAGLLRALSTVPSLSTGPHSSTTNLTLTTRCARSPAWQAYGFLVEDCFAAIQRVYIAHVLRHPDEVFEFFRVRSYGKTKHPKVQTPAVIDVGSCTLAVVMLDWFGPGALPGSPGGRFEGSDTATFRSLWKAAKTVEDDCLLPMRMPGWERVGLKGSIGVFLWATESGLNRQVTGSDGGLFSLDGLSLNGSNAGALDSVER